MFKKLLTTMLVMAVVVMAGTALAGDADWKFYGKLHSSINMLGNGENSQLGMTSNTSRFGFKGWKAMNDEWTLIWQFERSLNMVNKDDDMDFGIRNTFLGVKNEKIGQIRYGTHDTPFKTLGRKTTFFFDTIGDNRQMMFGMDDRLGDQLLWLSPDFNGFNLFFAYQFDQEGDKLDPGADEDAEFASDTRFSGMASYAKDEFFVGVAMEMYGEAYADTDDMDEYGDKPTALRFAGKYTAEQFALAAIYQTLKENEWFGEWYETKMTTLGFEGLYKANEKWHIKAGYFMADPHDDEDDDNVTLMTFGVDRIFSKNVMMYLQYAGLSYGDDADNWTLGSGNGFGGGVAGYMGTDGYENPYGFSFGTVVKF